MCKKSQEYSPLNFYAFGLNYLKNINIFSKRKRLLTEEVENMDNKHLNITLKQGLHLYNIQENVILRISVLWFWRNKTHQNLLARFQILLSVYWLALEIQSAFCNLFNLPYLTQSKIFWLSPPKYSDRWNIEKYFLFKHFLGTAFSLSCIFQF